SEREDPEQIREAETAALAPFARSGGEGTELAYAVQEALQDTMQDLVGIVRRDEEIGTALDEICRLKQRAARVAVSGHREYNPGWHTALDLENLLTVSEAVARAARMREESRGAHFRDDFPEKSAEWGRYNIVISRGTDGEMSLQRVAVPEVPDELKGIIEEMK